jgi:hypothetical protein
MHVPEIGRRTVFQGLGDDLTQALGRKGVIREAGQRQPLETHLTAVTLPALPDGPEVITETVEDRFDLMEVTVDPVHGVVLADVFAKVQQTLRHDLETQFLQHLALDGVPQGLAVILPSAWKDEKLPLLGPDPDRQDLLPTQDDRSRGRADA